MTAPDCEVCRLEPDLIVCERDDAVAFLPARQHVPGEIVVAPRRHVATLTALTIAELGAVTELWTAMQRTVLDVFRPDGLTISASMGPLAQQSWLGHYTVDITPRFEGVAYRFVSREELDPTPMADLASQRQRLCRRARHTASSSLGRSREIREEQTT